MKTTVKLFVSVFMVFATIRICAQEITGVKSDPKTPVSQKNVSADKDAGTASLGGGMPGSHLQLNGEEGEIYIGSEWPLGTIVLSNGGVIDNYFLRYDIMADQMQFISGKDTLAFASPQELNTISFGGHTFIYDTYQCENTVRKGYFELIEPGKNKLLLKRLVTYQLPDAKNPDDKALNRYYIDECFFVSKPGKPANKIMCNRKSALSYLNDHSDEIDEYLRITGNKVKTLEDLKKLVAYYNTLDE
jgi:hypothetical protein